MSSNIELLEDGWCQRTLNLINITISPENKHFQNLDGKLLIGLSKENDKLLYFANLDIEQITIPSTIKEIKSNSFELCKKLQTVNFLKESRLVKICKEAFSSSLIKSIMIPKHVTEICDKCFHYCHKI